MKFIIVFMSLLCVSQSVYSGSVLEAVKKRGHIKCGVSEGLSGFSRPDSKGRWVGIDVDVCRSFAAALFGDLNKIQMTGLSALQRFTALQSGEVDVLSRNTTYTLTRDTSLGLNFAPITYYDGQGIMVKKTSGIKSAKELGGASICVQQGTTTERSLADFFRSHSLKFKPIVMESNDEVFNTFAAGRCDAVTSDMSSLASDRSRVKSPDSLIILPEVLSKEPLGPAVRHGDDEWFDVVTWSVYAMIAAEEMGITSKNVDAMKKSKNPDVRRFLGVTPGNGKALGLAENWAYNIVKQVGNYGEVFERNVGKSTPLKLERGNNALWTKGGLMYAPPLK